MNTDEERFDGITERIIGRAYRVGNVLGSGFLESVYQNAMVHEMRKSGLNVQAQMSLDVWYDGVVVGHFIADLIVENIILVELKAIDALAPIHAAQCINYLAATKLPMCLLINFGKRVDVKRLVGPNLSPSPS